MRVNVHTTVMEVTNCRRIDGHRTGICRRIRLLTEKGRVRSIAMKIRFGFAIHTRHGAAKSRTLDCVVLIP